MASKTFSNPARLASDALLGPIEDLVRRAAGNHAAVVDDHGALAKRVDLAMTVRDVDHGNPVGVVRAAEVVHDAGLDGVIERRERLVEQQQRRFGHQCASQCRALTLAARDLRRLAIENLGRCETTPRSPRRAAAARRR